MILRTWVLVFCENYVGKKVSLIVINSDIVCSKKHADYFDELMPYNNVYFPINFKSGMIKVGFLETYVLSYVTLLCDREGNTPKNLIREY